MRNSRGFSLLEITVAMGMLGVLSLGTMKLVGLQSSSNKKFTQDFNMNEEERRVRTVMFNLQACENTLQGLDPIAGANVPAIKDGKGNIILAVNSIVAQGSGGKMLLTKIRISDYVSGNNTSRLTLSFEQVAGSKKTLGRGQTINRKIEINTFLDPPITGVIKNCSAAGLTVVEETCNPMFAGDWVEPKCRDITVSRSAENATAITSEGNLKVNESLGVGSAVTIPDGDGRLQVGHSAVIGHNTFVPDNSGDLVVVNGIYVGAAAKPTGVGNIDATGTITAANLSAVTGNITTVDATTLNATNHCDAAGKCRTTFADTNCAAGKVVMKINADGSVLCGTVNCPNKNYFEGLNSDGTPRCIPLPTKDCATVKQYVSKVNNDGSFECSPLPPNAAVNCGAGEYLRSIAADGSPTCVKAFAFNQTCPINEYISGIDAYGKIVCSRAGGKKMSGGGWLRAKSGETKSREYNYIANSCSGLLVIDVKVSGSRNNGSGEHYLYFRLGKFGGGLKDIGPGDWKYDWTVGFYGERTGDKGHGWNYGGTTSGRYYYKYVNNKGVLRFELKNHGYSSDSKAFINLTCL